MTNFLIEGMTFNAFQKLLKQYLISQMVTAEKFSGRMIETLKASKVIKEMIPEEIEYSNFLQKLNKRNPKTVDILKDHVGLGFFVQATLLKSTYFLENTKNRSEMTSRYLRAMDPIWFERKFECFLKQQKPLPPTPPLKVFTKGE